ncbi:MAG: hypothetical protein ACOYLU_16030, partial [Limisphaerales bacterium]
YLFLYRYEHPGGLHGAGGSFFETGFVADILKGMDLLILEANVLPVSLSIEEDSFRRARVDPTSPDGRYVFLLIQYGGSDLQPLHTIRLPHAFSRKVRELGRSPVSGVQPALQQFIQPLLSGGQK